MALEEFHRQVMKTVVLADIVDQDDVGVTKPSGQSCLTEESSNEVLLIGEVRTENLQGTRMLQRDVDGAVDPTHPASPDQAQDLVRTDRSSDQAIHRGHVTAHISGIIAERLHGTDGTG